MEKEIYRLASTYEENKVYLRHDGKLTSKLILTENNFLYDSDNIELYNKTSNISVIKHDDNTNIKIHVKDEKEIIDSSLIREYKLYQLENNCVYLKRDGTISAPIKKIQDYYVDDFHNVKYDENGYVINHLKPMIHDLILPIEIVSKIVKAKPLNVFEFFDFVERINRIEYNSKNVSFNSELHKKVTNLYSKLIEKYFMLDIPQTINNLCYFSDNFVYSLEIKINQYLDGVEYDVEPDNNTWNQTELSNNEFDEKPKVVKTSKLKKENRQKIIDYFVSLTMQLFIKNNIIIDFKLSKLNDEKLNLIGMKLDYVKSLIDKEGTNFYSTPKTILIEIPDKLSKKEILDNTISVDDTDLQDGYFIMNPAYVYAFEIKNNQILSIRPISRTKKSYNKNNKK